MGNYSPQEHAGLIEFFTSNPDLLVSIAKTISKSKEISPKDAFDIVLLHSSSATHILNRKAITREVLFNYLHAHKVPVMENFTKLLLIERIIEYWNGSQREECSRVESPSVEQYQQQQQLTRNEDFPINRMSREFCKWFFERFNSGDLTTSDFLADSFACIRVVQSQDSTDSQATGSEDTLRLLATLKSQTGVVFNPNLFHEGCQGRIDPHGLTILFCCGSLHTIATCVGIFESAFGLARDPFDDNNWKIKHLKMQVRSTAPIGHTTLPSLAECVSLREILALPETSSAL